MLLPLSSAAILFRVALWRHRCHPWTGPACAYVGSAQRNLAARLARHARRRKPLRWHIDYLSTRAKMLGAAVIKEPKTLECRLANALARTGASPVAGFGCSDCRCQSHLYRVSWGSVCHQDPNG